MKSCNCVTQSDTRRVRGIYNTLYQIKTKILLTPIVLFVNIGIAQK